MDIRVLRIVPDTIVDGPGLRTSVYCAGCSHRCPGCHNPQTWDFAAGTPMSPREIFDAILAESPDSDITFTGGDPLYQSEGFTELAQLIKTETPGKTIWCYTGFRFEEILADEKMSRLLPWIDVLVDGPFVLALRDTKNLRFRGSSNQRLVDVPASLRAGTAIEWESAYGGVPASR
ncbi:MAG: anaerobic ribonucleoside-triphosphate reductase activating protein [Opitutales bacterium]|nr:anaerobic ribonucleoside-triphosphate reductase activating protein [Opitutales bacterium]